MTEVAALYKAARDGAMIGGFHPMQIFGDSAAAVRSLAGCTITVGAQEPLNGSSGLTGPAAADAASTACQRACANAITLRPGYTSQFINALFGEAAAIWRSWGATAEEAVRALLPLTRGTFTSIESAGIAGGTPGTVSRGDVDSVAKSS